MITPDFAAQELLRLSGLDFYPNTSTSEGQASFRELRLELGKSANEATARAIVDEWLARNTAAPKPAQIRELVYAANEQHRRQQARLPDCVPCDGSGMETRHYLVTYHRNSFRKKRVERLHLDQEALIDLRGTVLAYPEPGSTFDAQQVISGALTCIACHGTGKQAAAA